MISACSVSKALEFHAYSLAHVYNFLSQQITLPLPAKLQTAHLSHSTLELELTFQDWSERNCLSEAFHLRYPGLRARHKGVEFVSYRPLIFSVYVSAFTQGNWLHRITVSEFPRMEHLSTSFAVKKTLRIVTYLCLVM